MLVMEVRLVIPSNHLLHDVGRTLENVELNTTLVTELAYEFQLGAFKTLPPGGDRDPFGNAAAVSGGAAGLGPRSLLRRV